MATLNIKRLKPMFSYQEVCKLHDITEDQWIDEFNPGDVPLNNKLDDLVPMFNAELTHTLDKLAPLKKQKINLRHKNPWYDMRKREKRWLKYRLESCWTAYKKCQNSYYGKLIFKKKQVLKAKFA